MFAEFGHPTSADSYFLRERCRSEKVDLHDQAAAEQANCVLRMDRPLDSWLPRILPPLIQALLKVVNCM